MALKIKKKKFSDFVNKIMMDGTQQISEVLFNFDEPGLKMSYMNKSGHSQIKALLKRDAFKEYEALGNVGLSNLNIFKKVVDRFSDIITIEKEGNLLNMKEGGKSVGVELTDEKYLQGEGKTVSDEKFSEKAEMPANKLKEVFDDVKLNKDCELLMETGEGKLIFTNTGQYKFRTEVNAPECKGGVKIKFGQPLLDALSKISENLTVLLEKDFPVKVYELNDDMNIEYLVAPKVEEE